MRRHTRNDSQVGYGGWEEESGVGGGAFPQSIRVGVPGAPRPFDIEDNGDGEGWGEEEQRGGEWGDEEQQGEEWGDGGWPREDGSVAPRRPARYGARWTRIVFQARDLLEADPNYRFLRQVAGTANTDVETLYRGEDVREVAAEAGRVATAGERGRAEAVGVWEEYQGLERLLRDDIEAKGAHTDIARLHRAARDLRAAAWLYHAEKGWIQDSLWPYVRAAGPTGELPAAAGPARGETPTRREFVDAASLASEGWAVALLDTPDFSLTQHVALAWLREQIKTDLATSLGGGKRGGERRALQGGLQGIAGVLRELRKYRKSPPRARERNRADYEALLFVLAVLAVSWERALRVLPRRIGALQGAGSLESEDVRVALNADAPVKTPEGEESKDWVAFPATLWRQWATAVVADLSMKSVRRRIMEGSAEYLWLHSLAATPLTLGEKGRRDLHRGEVLEEVADRFDEARDDVVDDLAPRIAQTMHELPEVDGEGEEEVAPSPPSSVRAKITTRLVAAAGGMARFLNQNEIEIGTLLDPPDVGVEEDEEEEEEEEEEGGSLGGGGKGKERAPPPRGRSRADALVRLAGEARGGLMALRKTVKEARSKIHGALKQLLPILEESATGAEERVALQQILEEHVHGFEAEIVNGGRGAGQGAKRPRSSAPASPRPGWALRPMFTGRISLSAPALSALERALRDVRHWFPGLAPDWMTDQGVKRGLMQTPGLSQLFADLVASYLLESAIHFPRQWQADKALVRAHRQRIGIMTRLGSWVWGAGGPYDTREANAATTDAPHTSGALPAPLHPGALVPPAPEPLYPGDDEKAGARGWRGAAARSRLGGGGAGRRVLPPTLVAAGAALPPGRERGTKRRRGDDLERGADGLRALCEGRLARWTHHDVRRIVMEAARKTVYTPP